MAGGSFAIPIGEVTFKGEAAWYPERDEEYAGTFGVEWMHGDFTFIAEAYGAWDTQNDSLNSQIGAVLSYDLLDGDLQLSLSGIVEMKKYDGAVLFEATGIPDGFGKQLLPAVPDNAIGQLAWQDQSRASQKKIVLTKSKNKSIMPVVRAL